MLVPVMALVGAPIVMVLPVRGAVFFLDRDNTGNGQEALTISAIDGAGNVIFGPVVQSVPVGSRLSIPIGTFFAYSAPPVANPILVTLTSNAGNGFSQQIVYSVLGACIELPTTVFNTIGLDIIETDGTFVVIDGTTSPSVNLNADPPRPTNPDGLGAFVDGYLIVNTASLNIRSGDGPQYTLVGRVSGGTELIVFGRNADRTWWFVQVGEIRGWVNGTLTIARGDLTLVPIAPVNGEILGPRFYVYADTYLLAVPVANTSWLCEIEGDTEYFIIGQDADGEFIQIVAECNGATVIGWLGVDFGAIRNSGSIGIPVTAQ